MVKQEKCGSCGQVPTACICDVSKVGKKFDKGKLRYDLLPLGPLEQVTDIITFGSEKYGPNNWQKVDKGLDRYYAAAMRHLIAWKTGEKIDQDSGRSHLAHVGCNLFFMMWLEDQGKAE